ncbi:putative membrane protein YphA (DoxX/SURF4 family) [Crossiella equi]|uniref:Membrane protein YphA (DoxX/SURF4 family) n=1 Tax=Crossiella equi TaxID=130796 RepID=A0ABS5AQ77_9PSEU|nr:DoxX family protein [Crossiella equi]MBP2478721.1 putative membrane protein YphA (DoxX/SURF4 family) [Crossiella equi]
MSDAATTARTGGIARTIGLTLLWLVQIALGAYLAYSGYLLFGPNFVGKFDKIGFGQWLRYVTGVLEMAGGVGLLVPRVCGFAALLVTAVMGGAAFTELVLLGDNGGAVLPAQLAGVALLVALLRGRETVATVSRLVSGSSAARPRPRAS